jgi:hypothetical protein
MIDRPVGTRTLLTFGLIASLLIAVVGCGDGNKARVTGKVLRKDGSPLVGARVIARSKGTGTSATSITDDQGEYELGTNELGDAIPPGDYDVLVVEFRGDPDYPNPPTISTKYAQALVSGLKLSVQAGETKEFDMTLDPP